MEVADCFQREEDRTLVGPEEVAVEVEEVQFGGVEKVQFGGVEDLAGSVAAGDEWVVPAGYVAVRIFQEEGFHGCKRVVVDLGVGVWVQVAGVGQPVEKRIGSKVDERRVPVVGMSSAGVVAIHGTQEEDRTVQAQAATGVASGFVVVGEGEYWHCLAAVEGGAMDSGLD